MKRITTIVMLAAFILVGSTNIGAKTTKKGSKSNTSQTTRKSRSSLSINTFVEYRSGFYWFKDLNTIYEAINKMGYSYLEHENYDSYTTVSFYKNSNEIEITYNDINVDSVDITFGSTNEKNNFIQTIKNLKQTNLKWEEKGKTVFLECEH